MRVSVYSFNNFERQHLIDANKDKFSLELFPTYLNRETAKMCVGSDAVSLFVNDDASAPVLEILKANGIKFLALRSAGYNHVDLVVAKRLGLKVAHVPEYSPYAVAEHAV